MFQKLFFGDRAKVALPPDSEDVLLTRFGPEQDQPDCSSQLTRYNKRHTREPVVPHIRDVSHDVPRARVVSHAPKSQHVVQLGPDLDLYSVKPISINVLMRALPQRFRENDKKTARDFSHADMFEFQYS